MTVAVSTTAGGPCTAAGRDPVPAAPASRRLWAPGVLAAGATAVGVVLWTVGMAGADPRAMNRLGLLSVLTLPCAFALCALLAGVLLAVFATRSDLLAGLNLSVLLIVLHGTPAVLYGTVRYAWSYKHLGMVDFILRHGGVDPTIDVEQIYHNWPGFFAVGALLSSASGASDATALALWAPVAFNLMNLLLARWVLRALTDDRRVVWTGLLIFFLSNWVGQDYFSPQAWVFAVYLAAIGLLLRGRPGAATTVPYLALVSVIAVSHQITAIVMACAVTALVALRRVRGWALPVATVAILALWALTFAAGYTTAHLGDLIEGVGDPIGNADQTLAKPGPLDAAQVAVVWGGRAATGVVIVLAVLGAWRRWRRGRVPTVAVALAAVPGLLIVLTSFSGESLFRAVLFASPFLSLLAAYALIPSADRPPRRRTAVAVAAVALVLTPLFLLGYYGKEQQNYFPHSEVAAARWLARTAGPAALLVTGDPNYPSRSLEYEKFIPVTISVEPPASIDSVLLAPAAQLAQWLRDPRYSDAYVLITRGQKIAADVGGALPPGALEAIDAALRADPQFRIVYENRDAVVFALADTGRGPGR